MEILMAFVWGMITVFYIGMVVVVVQMRKEVKSLESQIRDLNEGIEDIYLQIEKTNSEFARDLKDETNKLVDYSDSINKNTENNINEVYRYIDSRFDKFESRIQNDTPAQKIKELKTQFDEFVRTYQNQ
jgi:chromosome segregation ATPase